jgi:hypothetical protein
MMYVRLGANLERNSRGGGVGVIYRLGASLNIGANTVVVARSEGAQVVETMESDRVLGRRKPEGSRILGDTAFGNIVGCFGTNEEAIAAKHGVSGKCRALRGKNLSMKNKGRNPEGDNTNLEDIQNRAGVKARLLVGGAEEDRLCVLVRVESGGGVELEAFGDLVLELDLGAERVMGGPGLSDGQAVVLVRVFALEVAGDVGRF